MLLHVFVVSAVGADVLALTKRPCATFALRVEVDADIG
jgi:hypothetical protein